MLAWINSLMFRDTPFSSVPHKTIDKASISTHFSGAFKPFEGFNNNLIENNIWLPGACINTQSQKYMFLYIRQTEIMILSIQFICICLGIYIFFQSNKVITHYMRIVEKSSRFILNINFIRRFLHLFCPPPSRYQFSIEDGIQLRFLCF